MTAHQLYIKYHISYKKASRHLMSKKLNISVKHIVYCKYNKIWHHQLKYVKRIKVKNITIVVQVIKWEWLFCKEQLIGGEYLQCTTRYSCTLGFQGIWSFFLHYGISWHDEASIPGFNAPGGFCAPLTFSVLQDFRALWCSSAVRGFTAPCTQRKKGY